MKNIYVILILLSALFISCDKDDYEAPYGDYSSFIWLTTNGFEGTDYVSALNDYIGFSDVSKNAIEHTWKIPSGTKMLSNDFTENDSIYSQYIISSGPASSKEKLLNVLFVESGVKEIILKNVFRDSVKDAIKMDGSWVVEETFTVTVFDDIKPAFKVMRGEVEVLSISESDMPDAANRASWPTVTIEDGEELTYVDMTTVGEPDARTWTFEGGHLETSNASSVKVLYNSLGNFFAGHILSKRNLAEKPKGQSSKIIPLNIKVIPSTKPFVINGGVIEEASGVISFKVTGEVKDITELKDNFIVHVVNDVAGFNQNIAVESVKVNPNDATQIDLVLSEAIYNSDEVTITYESGFIESVDNRLLESFGPINVKMNFNGVMNVAGFTGFEAEYSGNGNQFKKANTEGYFAQHNANNESGPLYYWRDASMAYEGKSSMKFETPSSGIPKLARLQGSDFNTLSPVTAGTYIPSLWVYIDAGTTMKIIEYNFTSDIRLEFDISSAPKEQWVQLKLPEINVGDINTGRLDIEIAGAGQDDARVQKLWLDSFDLLIVEQRK